MHGEPHTRSHRDNVREVIRRIEASGDAFLIDQAAFLLGLFKESGWVAEFTEGCPRITALLPEMGAEPNRFYRLLACADWMDADNDLGYLADQIRKWEPH